MKQEDADELFDGMQVFAPEEYMNKAIIGSNEQGGPVYDMELLREAFRQSQPEWDDEEIDEWISYNTIRTMPYMDSHPTIVERHEDFKLYEVDEFNPESIESGIKYLEGEVARLKVQLEYAKKMEKALKEAAAKAAAKTENPTD